MDRKIQTDEYSVSEVSTQQPYQSSSETQTLMAGYKQSSTSFARLNEVNESNNAVSVDYHRLNTFLSRSVSLIEREIRDSCQFEQLSLPWLNYWNGSSGKGIHCEQRLTSKILDDLLSDIKSGFSGGHQIISGITWNAPQTTLAVCYRLKSHTDWCTHRTFLLFWNLYTRKSGHSRPLYSCEVDNCVTSLIAHPQRGSLYAIGCYNGTLFIIDTRLLDTTSDLVLDLPISHSSPNRGDLHQESIIGLQWLKVNNDRKMSDSGDAHLISFSSEGLIIRWKMESKSKLLKPLDLFNVTLTDLPKSMGLKQTLGDVFKCVPILSFTWEPESDSGFIVGCEAGGLFRCSLHGNLRQESLEDPVRPSDWLPCKNPIVMAYVPHRAGVVNVNFSPNLRNIFVSSGKDDELRIWEVFQSKPLFVVHCDVNILATVWLSTRPVIFTVQEDGFLCIYSITNKSKPKLIHRFSLEERKSARCIWTNVYSRTDQIAVTDEDNTIHLYSVNLTSDNIILTSD